MPPSSIKGITRTKKVQDKAPGAPTHIKRGPPLEGRVAPSTIPLNLTPSHLVPSSPTDSFEREPENVMSIDENHITINIEETTPAGSQRHPHHQGGSQEPSESSSPSPQGRADTPLPRSISIPQGTENDITSEGDIENENGSCKQLVIILHKINSFKRANSKFRRISSINSINSTIEKVIDDIRAIKYVDTDNKKFINSLRDKLNELVEKNLSKGITDENKYKGLYEDILEIYKKFKSKNFDELERVKKDKLKMNINHEKDFNKHLQNKLNFLNDRLDLLQMKYNGYKNWYDRMNIGIIIISTVLSVFESFRLEIQELIHKNNHGLTITFNMTPIIISSSITCSAAVIKFKKYQEKMEDMQFAREKVITSISKIEYVMESLWFNKDGDFENIKTDYLKDVFIVYNESIAELKRHIKFDDPQKFDKHIDDKNKENNKNKNKNSYI
tara:strand:- start:272 stop:1603 length:1332 start_codon:yes stop_codon:yes gene_type:complete